MTNLQTHSTPTSSVAAFTIVTPGADSADTRSNPTASQLRRGKITQGVVDRDSQGLQARRSSSVQTLELHEVASWAREVLLDPGRRYPVIAVTTDPNTREPRISPEELVAALGGKAEVVCLDTGPATFELRDALPLGLGVHSGAVRIWWPGLWRWSQPKDHEIFFFDDPRHHRASFDALVRKVHSRASSRESELGSQVVVLERKLEAAGEEQKALREQIRLVKRELRTARDRLRGRGGSDDAVVDALSSEPEFLLAVRVAYARMLDEGSRQEHALQKMRLGREFLATCRALDGIDPSKIVEVCAQVAAGLAHEIEGRDVHPLRSGPRGSDTRIRASDGARAWRCALQAHRPAARRLHWWAVPGPDGQTVEFAKVGVHDDFSIPE